MIFLQEITRDDQQLADDVLNPIQGEFHSPESLQGGSEMDLEDDPFLPSDDEPKDHEETKFYYEDIVPCGHRRQGPVMTPSGHER